ncbi:hypothetical protein B0J11DRAFT_512915 [Dendryphion nanum]|uniref:Uncharacterized protein n=1 Tax=Dendryphion nanum TaxID=256645 RepID=A0A9P9CY89_9PLEO|nr:hypothetical protein B0J11DRAFT_512915 [Dendryphion nanum]
MDTTTITALFTLLTTLIGLAFASPLTARDALFPRQRDPASCRSTRLITEATYNWGVSGFCSNFLPTDANPNPAKTITTKEPLIFTMVLPAYDKPATQMDWVYKIAVGTGNYANKAFITHSVDYETCQRKMKEVLSEGKLGDDYCVVDGTEDVLFKGGKLEEVLEGVSANKEWKGKVRFESYIKGTKPDEEMVLFD